MIIVRVKKQLHMTNIMSVQARRSELTKIVPKIAGLQKCTRTLAYPQLRTGTHYLHAKSLLADEHAVRSIATYAGCRTAQSPRMGAPNKVPQKVAG